VAAGQLVTGGTASGVANIISGDVFDLFHKVAPQYRTEQAVFMGRDATVKLVRVLKDTTGQYLWQPGLQAGIPDRLLGHRFVVNPDVVAANTSTKSLYFGRPDGYWAINSAGGITIQRLNELYAATGQVGFLRIGSDFVGPADSVAVYVQSAT
jgi:HK97 family phage major capsid protein